MNHNLESPWIPDGKLPLKFFKKNIELRRNHENPLINKANNSNRFLESSLWKCLKRLSNNKKKCTFATFFLLQDMKQTLLLAALLLVSVSLKGQTSLPSTGGDAVSSTCRVSYTVGQMAIQTAYERVVNGNQANVREGVQQTYTVEELKIDGAEPFSFNIKVYPNPTTDNVTIGVGGSVAGLRYELYDTDGRLIKRDTIRTEEQNLDLHGLPAGAYLLRVEGGSASKSYRIVKAK